MSWACLYDKEFKPLGKWTQHIISEWSLTRKAYEFDEFNPGPIRIPSPIGLDAVLNYTKHNYLYMCAKEDFSGTHNFASNYAEHMKNARRYWNALNERKIFK